MDFKHPMVRKSLALIRQMKRTYGDDKANEAWNALSDTIGDPELTFEIYKCLMNGGFGADEFIITDWDDNGNSGNSGSPKVWAIKTLRSWTQCGLKEAKDAIEQAPRGIPTKFKIATRYDTDGHELEIEHEKFENDMKSCGITVEIQ